MSETHFRMVRLASPGDWDVIHDGGICRIRTESGVVRATNGAMAMTFVNEFFAMDWCIAQLIRTV